MYQRLAREAREAFGTPIPTSARVSNVLCAFPSAAGNLDHLSLERFVRAGLQAASLWKDPSEASSESDRDARRSTTLD